MPWPSSEPPGKSSAPQGALTAQPVDPLPPRLTPPAPPQPVRRLTAGTWVFVPLVLVAGSPSGHDLLSGMSRDLPRADGIAAMGVQLARFVLTGLMWPQWELPPDTPRTSSSWLWNDFRTLLFVVLTLWLLSRLNALPSPARAYRALAVLGATMVSAVVAGLGAIACVAFIRSVGFLGDPGGRRSPWSDTEMATWGALAGGLVYGLLLAWLVTLPAAADRPRRGWLS
ncbi:hypothetical protein SAMN05443287_10265 [Micromonospora phaseoli]|uniref:Uncharacterized protein n=2 Tax=Micromonospora phaseoli TaxID=1144548 RepID=A0A1H6UD13_9ACTN|nr:hypothetical protein CLV64_10466 [Micromonospora phaseoli]GIJ76419.1 hypothetical protein Xph01_08510 [Micromonospora phaseoli]SEI86090.1 hypothetical protein SAMN05443287_10265 [Micromonospora phaseoli]